MPTPPSAQRGREGLTGLRVGAGTLNQQVGLGGGEFGEFTAVGGDLQVCYSALRDP